MLEDRRADVDELQPVDLARPLPGQALHDEDAVAVVVGPVGAGVVLVGVEARVADRADRAPLEIAEVDDQVGRDAAHLGVDVLRLEHLRAERLAVGAGRGLELGDQLVAHRLVVGRLDLALRLAALDVEEQAAVVPAVAPGARARPVDRRVLDRDRPVGDRLVERRGSPPAISQSLKHRPPIIGRAPWSLITIVTASSGTSSRKSAELPVEEPVVVLEDALVLVARPRRAGDACRRTARTRGAAGPARCRTS